MHHVKRRVLCKLWSDQSGRSCKRSICDNTRCLLFDWCVRFNLGACWFDGDAAVQDCLLLLALELIVPRLQTMLANDSSAGGAKFPGSGFKEEQKAMLAEWQDQVDNCQLMTMSVGWLLEIFSWFRMLLHNSSLFSFNIVWPAVNHWTRRRPCRRRKRNATLV